MTKQEYRKKLKQFNSTDKYKKEVDFMVEEMDLAPYEKVLDYGCGIGTMLEYIRHEKNIDVRGYDKFIYFEDEPDWFSDTFHFQFDVAYFMHSIAHIEELTNKLIILKDLLKDTAEVYVLTPNKDWIEKNNKPDYVADPTVINHFNKTTLTKVFNDAGYCVNECYPVFNNERLFLRAEL